MVVEWRVDTALGIKLFAAVDNLYNPHPTTTVKESLCITQRLTLQLTLPRLLLTLRLQGEIPTLPMCR